jgi:hypothetical protein
MLRARWSATQRLSFAAVLCVLTNVSPLPAADSKAAGETISGLHVAVDPSTGRLTAPTPDQRAKLAAALAQMIDQRTEGLEVRRLQNGARLVDLQGRFRNVAVAVRGTDGKVRLQCIDAPDELDGLLDRGSEPSPAPRPATKER